MANSHRKICSGSLATAKYKQNHNEASLTLVRKVSIQKSKPKQNETKPNQPNKTINAHQGVGKNA